MSPSVPRSRTSASRTRTPSARRCRGSGRRSWSLRPLGTGAAGGGARRRARRTPTTGTAWCRARGSRSTLVDGLRLYGEGENVPRGTGCDLRRRQRHATGVRDGHRLRPSRRGGRRPHLHPRHWFDGRRHRRAHPPRRRAAPGVGCAGLRRARAPRRDRRRSPLLPAGPPAARAGGRSGRGRRAVQDRGGQSRLRPHRGAARPGGAAAGARQADLRLPDVPVDARVLPGRRLRRRPDSPGRRAVGDRRRHERVLLQGHAWTASASTWTWCASARSRGRWSRS